MKHQPIYRTDTDTYLTYRISRVKDSSGVIVYKSVISLVNEKHGLVWQVLAQPVGIYRTSRQEAILDAHIWLVDYAEEHNISYTHI